MTTGRCFISYRRTDRGDLVERLYDRLDAHFGRGRVFIDVDGIPAGADFVAHIESILKQCDAVIAIVGPRWLEALRDRAIAGGALSEPDFVRVELERALALRKSVFPVLLGDARMPNASDVPEGLAALARLQATHLRSGPDFRTDTDRLIRALEGVLGAPDAGAQRQSEPAAERLKIACSGSELERNPDRLVGARIGPYVVERVIGAGGAGVALAASHAALARSVCLKLSFPLGDRTGTLMTAIRRGMRGLAQLDHPGIVRIHDFAEVDLNDGWSFFVAMDLVDGVTFDRWASSLTDSPDGADLELRVAAHIAEALAAAHACRYADDAGFQMTGVMHGDIKPSNIMIRRDGTPVLVDFMLVDVQRHLALTRERPRLEQSTAAFGTPGFMAPEQSERGVVTTATDIYGLGRTLIATLERARGRPGFVELAERMMQDDPRDRPESMAAIAAELEALRAQRPNPKAQGPKPKAQLPSLLRQIFRLRFR